MAFTSGRWQKPVSTSTEALEIFAKTAELIKIKQETIDSRPRCPECGGEPVSHGISWQCKACGRSWIKTSDGSGRKGPKRKDLGDRPCCPECGDNPISLGPNWRCVSCGKCWPKKYRSKNKIQFYKLNIDSIKEFLEWRKRG